jgi:Amt family ammonium transporter
MNPYPDWLNAGDNAWQLVAATLVGLMSIPGIAVLYGALVQKKWAVNTMLMAFTGFSLVLVVWVLWGFKMGFGEPLKLGPGILQSAVGKPRSILGADNQHQAVIPLLDAGMPKFRFSESTLAYFQFVFAGITPLLFLGSVVGRMNFKVWLIFVPLWSTFAYAVNAFLVWGGGFWAQPHPGANSAWTTGALDFSGGYVIHLAAGTSGFVAAAVIGPRLARDRQHAVPNNLPMAAVGAGILWLGWNGFNGGDPYFAGTNASLAVLNTNLATAVALLTWVIWDIFASRDRKPTFLGGINGMIVGLVAITPAAGFVNSFGAMIIGVVASSLVWMSWNWLGPALQEGRRHPRCGAHPRCGRPDRRTAGRPAGRPTHCSLPRQRQGCPRRHRRGLAVGPPPRTNPDPTRRRAHHHRLGRLRYFRHPANPWPVHEAACSR